jgi:hypothetical protein
MRVNAANWRSKAQVKDAVVEQIKKIVDFKQTQQQLERVKLLASIEEERSRNLEG